MTNEQIYAIISKANKEQHWKTECPIDQLTKTDVASIIRRATSGQPILGDPNRVFDGMDRNENLDITKNFGLDLDDVSDAMKDYNSETIESLQSKLQDEIKSKSNQEPPADPAPAATK